MRIYNGISVVTVAIATIIAANRLQRLVLHALHTVPAGRGSFHVTA